jgi:hypothetical protein
MKTHSVILAATALLISSGIASAQEQFDSPGSATPAPNQNAIPSNTGAGISGSATGDSIRTDANNKTKPDMSGTSYTTGAGVNKAPPSGVRASDKKNTGSSPISSPTDTSGTAPPGPLTDD